MSEASPSRTGRAPARPTRQVADRGASAVEYALMVAAIAALVVGIVVGLGSLFAEAVAGHP